MTDVLVMTHPLSQDSRQASVPGRPLGASGGKRHQAYIEALNGLKPGADIWVLTWLHQADRTKEKISSKAGNTKWTVVDEVDLSTAHFRPLSPLRSTKSTWYGRHATREANRAKSCIDKLHRRWLGLPDRVFAPAPCRYLRLPSA